MALTVGVVAYSIVEPRLEVLLPVPRDIPMQSADIDPLGILIPVALLRPGAYLTASESPWRTYRC